MEKIDDKKVVINRAIKNGITEIEANWYLQTLANHCDANLGVHGITAERLALEIFDDELAEYEAGLSNAFTRYKNKKERIPQKVLNLIIALQKANEEAMKFKDNPDGGTCNFDTPEIRLKGWKENTVKTACRCVGLDCQKWEAHYMNYHILGTCYGMADCRTTMAEAFAKSLYKSGFEASVYYAVD